MCIRDSELTTDGNSRNCIWREISRLLQRDYKLIQNRPTIDYVQPTRSAFCHSFELCRDHVHLIYVICHQQNLLYCAERCRTGCWWIDIFATSPCTKLLFRWQALVRMSSRLPLIRVRFSVAHIHRRWWEQDGHKPGWCSQLSVLIQYAVAVSNLLYIFASSAPKSFCTCVQSLYGYNDFKFHDLQLWQLLRSLQATISTATGWMNRPTRSPHSQQFQPLQTCFRVANSFGNQKLLWKSPLGRKTVIKNDKFCWTNSVSNLWHCNERRLSRTEST